MISNLLLSEPPLQVLPSLAKAIGLNEAIILQQIHYWLNPKHNKNIFGNRHWVYNTYEQWQEQFPFWSEITVRRTIGSLEKKNMLLTYSDNSSFRPIKYYTINYEALSELSKEQFKRSPGNINPKSNKSDMSSSSDHIDQLDLINMIGPSDQYDQKELINMSSSYIETENTTENTLPPLKSPPQRSKKEEEDVPEMMIKVWNELVQKNHPISTTKVRLTEERSEKLKLLFREYINEDLGEWSSYCQKIANSHYLMGKGESKFVAGLDWAIQPNNALKILEGAIYDKRPSLQKKPDLTAHDFQQELENHCRSISAPEGWLGVCMKLTSLHSQVIFRSWFAKLKPIENPGKYIRIEVETCFMKDYISANYGDDLGVVLRDIYPDIESFELVIPKMQGR